MQYFTKSTVIIGGITYYRYAADRTRGTEEWVFFNSVPAEMVYDPTWPKAIELDPQFLNLQFHSCLVGDSLCVDCINELQQIREEALDSLYENHVGPVPAP